MPPSGPADHPTEITLRGARLTADPSGALYWPDEGLLVVADLHFEKGSSFARRGVFLPPYDTGETLTRLEAAIARFAPARVLALGDSFHDRGGEARLTAKDRERIKALTHARDWLWLTGNHDPAPPRELGGDSTATAEIGPLFFTHEPGPRAGTVGGHLHPCASIRSHGRRVRRRCFVSDGERLVLPSFGAYTGGLCVFDPAFALVLQAPFEAILLGARAYRIAQSKLVPDKAA